MEMEVEFKGVIECLKRNRFDVVLADTVEVARNKILEIIPFGASVGVANSATVRQIGVLEALKERGNVVVDPISQVYGLAEFRRETFNHTMRETLNANVFISGTNAITHDGKLVNIDGVGNRVAGIIWSSRKSIIVIGRNKIVKNVDEAINRIKNTMVPVLARRRQLGVPCAKKGRCVDCDSPQRSCCITLILEKKPRFTQMMIIMVDEDLGLGWDPEWPIERIEGIKRKYEQFDWPYSSVYRDAVSRRVR